MMMIMIIMTMRLKMTKTMILTMTLMMTMLELIRRSAPGCGGELFGTRGVVTSQNYPANINSTSDCSWVLRVPTGQNLQLRFTTFNIHSNERGVCDGNYLEIIDGLRSDNLRRLRPR